MIRWPRFPPRVHGESPWWWSCLAVAASCLMGGVTVADEIELLDGVRHEGSVSRIASDGALLGERFPEKLKLDDLRRVRHEATGESRPATVVVDLVDGLRLLAHSVEIRDERVVVDVTGESAWSLPLDIVRGVRCDTATATSAYSQALSRPGADVDRFFVRAEDAGAVESFDALVEQLGPASVSFELGGKPRELPRERLYGIVFARPANVTPPKFRGWAELKNGSRVPFDKLELAAGTLKLSGPVAVKFDVPWSLVRTIDIRSARLTFLSDLEPTKVDESSLVVPARSWRRDKSVGGKRLAIGNTTFDKGLGVQATSRLSFKLDRQYEFFLASVGIDVETAGEGDCMMAVLADDGRTLWRERVRGGEPPRPVRLAVRDVQALTLVVEAGEDLDLSDHANWADARLIRPKGSIP